MSSLGGEMDLVRDRIGGGIRKEVIPQDLLSSPFWNASHPPPPSRRASAACTGTYGCTDPLILVTVYDVPLPSIDAHLARPLGSRQTDNPDHLGKTGAFRQATCERQESLIKSEEAPHPRTRVPTCRDGSINDGSRCESRERTEG